AGTCRSYHGCPSVGAASVTTERRDVPCRAGGRAFAPSRPCLPIVGVLHCRASPFLIPSGKVTSSVSLRTSREQAYSTLRKSERHVRVHGRSRRRQAVSGAPNRGAEVGNVTDRVKRLEQDRESR